MVLPKGYMLEGATKFKNIKGSGADFSGSIRKNGRKLVIKKLLKMKKRIYQPGDWQSFKESVMEFKKPNNGYLVFKRGGRS